MSLRNARGALRHFERAIFFIWRSDESGLRPDGMLRFIVLCASPFGTHRDLTGTPVPASFIIYFKYKWAATGKMFAVGCSPFRFSSDLRNIADGRGMYDAPREIIFVRFFFSLTQKYFLNGVLYVFMNKKIFLFGVFRGIFLFLESVRTLNDS